MITELNRSMEFLILLMVVLLISACSASVDMPQSPNQPSGKTITIEGVTVSATQITLHGKTDLPDTVCITTELLADGYALPWWPAETCVDVNQGKWTLNVSLEGKTLQTGTQFVIQAYQNGGQKPVATFAFDTGGPPQPSE